MITTAFACELATKFGTPLYAYDLVEVEKRARELVSVLPDASRLFYSVKANPLPGIVAHLGRAGLGAEVSSSGELEAVLEAGVRAEDVVYSGPGKTPLEISQAVARGVVYFSCESFTDLCRLDQASRDFEVRLRILLRVNPANRSKALISMSGVRSQFGFEEADLLGHADRFKEFRHVEIVGVHVYFGTQIETCEALLAAFEAALEAAERVGAGLKFSPRIIDVGGGFPWPYASHGAGPDLMDLRQGLRLLAERAQRMGCAELWFESGRYLVAGSGRLLTSVMDVKQSKDGNRLVVLDAGINHLAGMAGLGRLIRPSIAAELVDDPADREKGRVDLVGPLCTPLDCIGRNVHLEIPRSGELIQIPNVGAYGLTASLVGFLSRPYPVEVLHRGSELLCASRLTAGYAAIGLVSG
jgi:diaminopimelate decarboxylase